MVDLPAVVVNYTLTLELPRMPLPRLRFTVRRLMVTVAIVAVELGFALFLQREGCNPIGNPDVPMNEWVKMGILLAFLNIFIVLPACIFVVWVHDLGRVDQEPGEDG
jgi:hypothetical protein